MPPLLLLAFAITLSRHYATIAIIISIIIISLLIHAMMLPLSPLRRRHFDAILMPLFASFLRDYADVPDYYFIIIISLTLIFHFISPLR
jgi:hypothetical protein